jgi:hypothetical protein
LFASALNIRARALYDLERQSEEGGMMRLAAAARA